MVTQPEPNRGQGAAGKPDPGCPDLPHELVERVRHAVDSYDPTRIPPPQDVYRVESLAELERKFLERFRELEASGDWSRRPERIRSIADDLAEAEREYWDRRIDLEQAEMARERARAEAKAAKRAARLAAKATGCATRNEAKGTPAPPKHRQD